MKKANTCYSYIQACLITALLYGCSSQTPDFQFEQDCLLPHTYPSHQGRTSNCWAYSLCAMLESEVLQAYPQREDTLYLSPEFAVRNKFMHQMQCRMEQNHPAALTTGGLGQDFLHTYFTQGVMPRHCYRTAKSFKTEFHKMFRSLQTNESSSYSTLNQYLPVPPDTFIYRSQKYTPSTLRDSLNQAIAHNRNKDNYQWKIWTSMADARYERQVILPLKDNWKPFSFYNVELNKLIDKMKSILKEGHTFAWHGDVSEKTFSAKLGIAYLKQTHVVSEQQRLNEYQCGNTTDDHMMQIIGLAHTPQGELFFIAKNSYGRYGKYNGLVYMSENYMRAKTLSIVFAE